MQWKTTTKFNFVCRGTMNVRGSLRATLSEYIKNHIKGSNCFVQPSLFDSSSIKFVKSLYFWYTISLHLVQRKVERYRGHRKLFKLACVSISNKQNCITIVVVLFNIAIAPTTGEIEKC